VRCPGYAHGHALPIQTALTISPVSETLDTAPASQNAGALAAPEPSKPPS
jgi:hypothetical protein